MTVRRGHGFGSITSPGPGRWLIRWYETDAGGRRRRRAEMVRGSREAAVDRLAAITGRRSSTITVVDQDDEPAQRLPVEPLLDVVAGNVSRLAELAGVSRKAVHRARQVGLRFAEGDRWACALGRHPLEVWGDSWLIDDADDCRHDPCNDHHHERAFSG